MRILSVITRLNIGGASPMVLALTTGLKQFDHETLLVVGTPEPGEGTLEDEARAAGADVTRIPSLRRNPHPVRDAVALTALVRLFRRWRPDVVATHMSKAGALGRIAGALTGVPVVHTYHGKGFHVFNGGLKTSLALNAERLLARISAGTIVVSDVQRKEFQHLRLGDPVRQRVIHYGLPLEPFVAAAQCGAPLRAELGVGPEIKLVGVIGRVIGIKGQDIFIRAARELTHSHPAARFVIVGDGDARALFEALAAEIGIGHLVTFLGWRRDIPQVLASLDVVVLPTVLDFEGVPVAVIEALAAARPVVATNVGGVAEVVHDRNTGRLVPARDVAAMAAAIANLLDDPAAAAAMGRRGQQLAQQLFHITRYLKESDAFLREIANPHRAAADGVPAPRHS